MRARLATVLLLAVLTVGCTPGQAILVTLVACRVADCATRQARRSCRSASRRREPEPHPVSYRRPRVQPAVVGPRVDTWRADLQAARVAYRKFRYAECQEILTRVIDDPAAPVSARATALIYRGTARYLMGDADDAERDFRAANALGGKIDTGVFRPDVIRLYRRCAAIEA